MDITLLFKSIIGLVIILGFLILILVLPQKMKAKKKKLVEEKAESVKKSEPDEHSFEKLHTIIKKKASTTDELKDALELILKYHPNIHKKLGIRPHPESDAYMDVIFKLCRHKNTNTKITINFINEIEKLNPQYKKEINDAMMRGLNSRGF